MSKKAVPVRSVEEANALALQYFPFLHKLVGKLQKKCSSFGLGPDDAFQTGFLGLRYAALHWRKDGAPFFHYAARCVYVVLHRECFRQGLIRVPDYGGIEPYRSQARRMRRLPVLSQHEKENPFERDVEDAMRKAWDTLPPRHREILFLRFWEDCTLQEIGNRLHLCRERVRQLQNTALHRLQEKITSILSNGVRKDR